MAEKLDGYKTYLIAVALAAVAGAKYLGWITPEAASALENILLGGAIMALRQGVAKTEEVAAKTDAVKKADAKAEAK